MPVLGQQPPLPRNDQQAAVRIVQTDQHMDDGALVPTWPYYEEASYEQPAMMMYEEQSMVRGDMYEPALHDSHQRENNFSQNDGVSLSQ